MKICYVAPDLGHGGAQKPLCDLIAHIKQAEACGFETGPKSDQGPL